MTNGLKRRDLLMFCRYTLLGRYQCLFNIIQCRLFWKVLLCVTKACIPLPPSQDLVKGLPTEFSSVNRIHLIFFVTFTSTESK